MASSEEINFDTRRLSALRAAAQRARIEERAEQADPTEQMGAKMEIAGVLETMTFGLRRGEVVHIEENSEDEEMGLQVRVANVIHILSREVTINTLSALLFPRAPETELRQRLLEGHSVLVNPPQPPSGPARILAFRPRT